MLESGAVGGNVIPRLRRRPASKEVGPCPEALFGPNVRAATERLPQAQAEAIWLVNVCGYSYERAAITTGVSRGQVAERVAEARQRIRQELGDPADNC